MKKVAISQPNYLPWIGYFDLISNVDAFVILDDAQYTRRDWRNRNRFKTISGVSWLSVPVEAKQHQGLKINDVKTCGLKWMEKHWNFIHHNYSKSPYYKNVSEVLKPFYFQNSETINLCQFNVEITTALLNYLGINTPIKLASSFMVTGSASSRLAQICSSLDASHYVSGPAAKSYLDERNFEERNIEVTWFDYPSYPKYCQQWGQFESNLSALDVMMNVNPNAFIAMLKEK